MQVHVFANPAAWIAADLFLIPAYFHVMKHLKKMIPGTVDHAQSVKEAETKKRKPLHALG